MANIVNQYGQVKLGVRSTIAYPTDSDAQAFITAAAITNTTQQSAIITLVTQLKTYGIWSKMKALYPFVGGTAAQHRFNLKDPRAVDAAYYLTFFGGGTHSATGYLPNGNSYANTKLMPSVLSTNSQHLSYYSRTQIISAQIEIGANSSANNNFLGIYYSPTSGLRTSLASGTRTNIAIPSTNTQGFFMSNRPSSTYINIWKNNSKLTTDNITSTGNDNAVMYIGAVNGTTIQYSTKESAFASIGDGLTDTEATNFYTAVQTFQTTLGRNVGAPIGTDTDAQAFITAAVITDATQQTAINTLVNDLKSANIWNKMKALYPFVGGTAAQHRFNLKDPRAVDAAYYLTFNGGGTHSATGYLPNGNSYANTKLNPRTALGATSAHFSYYSRNATTSTSQNYVMGADDASGFNALILRNNSKYFRYTINNSAFEDAGLLTTSSTSGFFIGTQDGTNVKLFRNNTNIAQNTGSDVRQEKVNLPIFIGADNNNGSASDYTTAESAFASIGDGLTDTEATAFYNAVANFNTTLSRAV